WADGPDRIRRSAGASRHPSIAAARPCRNRPAPPSSRCMSPETGELFYGILALIAIGAIAVILIVRLLAIGSPAARGWFEAIGRSLRPNALSMAFIVALLAMVGSLYFSEAAHFEPCRLCWYQRIAMYPLAVILAVAA